MRRREFITLVGGAAVAFKDLRNNREWRLDVAGGTGTVRHVIRLTAEKFDR